MLTNAAVAMPMGQEMLGGTPTKKPQPVTPFAMPGMDNRSAGPVAPGMPGLPAPQMGGAPMAKPPAPSPTFGAQPGGKPSMPGQMPNPVGIEAPSVGVGSASAGKFDVEAFRPFADATYAEATRQLDPMFKQRENDFRQRMVNQGIAEGTEAFDNAFDNFSRERNDAFGSARNQALAQALGAQNQFFGQNFSNAQLAQQGQLANAQMGLQAQMANSSNLLNLFGLGENRRQFNSSLGQREAEFGRSFGEGQRQFNSQFGFGQERADMSDLMSLLGYGQGVDQYNNALLGQDQQRAMGLFGLIPGLSPTQLDVTGPMNSFMNAQAQANAQRAGQSNGMFGALGQLGGAAINAGGFGGLFNFSDARLKTDIQRVGTLDNGLPVYLYRYKAGGPMQIGVMAQDVQKVRPEAVAEIDGFLAVNYAEAAA